jgi:hypothetical protein
MSITEDAMREALNAMSYPELAQAMLDAKQAHTDAKAIATELNDAYQLIARGVVPERMERDQIQNITVIMKDGSKRRLQINGKISVKTPADRKFDLWSWLRNNDAEDIITETVNASTLSAFIGEQMRNGEPYPNEICDVSIYEVASLVKA